MYVVMKSVIRIFCQKWTELYTNVLHIEKSQACILQEIYQQCFLCASTTNIYIYIYSIYRYCIDDSKVCSNISCTQLNLAFIIQFQIYT